jgi:hypothetical protein
VVVEVMMIDHKRPPPPPLQFIVVYIGKMNEYGREK